MKNGDGGPKCGSHSLNIDLCVPQKNSDFKYLNPKYEKMTIFDTKFPGLFTSSVPGTLVFSAHHSMHMCTMTLGVISHPPYSQKMSQGSNNF